MEEEEEEEEKFQLKIDCSQRFLDNKRQTYVVM